MENVTDAIYIASAVLLFLIALSIAMYSFTEVRESVDNLFEQTETVEMAKNSQGYINYIQSSNATRIVGGETVVSSMYRSIKENYVVYIKLQNSIQADTYGLTVSEAYKGKEIKTEDNITLLENDDPIYRFTSGSNEPNYKIDEILRNGFYKELKGKKFYEYLGEYQNKSEASEENKLTYRIITYIEVPDSI